MYMYVSAGAQRPKAEELDLAVFYEPPDMGAENLTQVL